MIDFKVKNLLETGNRQKGFMVIYEGENVTEENVTFYKRSAKLEENYFDIHNDDLPEGLMSELTSRFEARALELNKQIV